MSSLLIGVTGDRIEDADFTTYGTPAFYVDGLVAGTGATPVLLPPLGKNYTSSIDLNRLDGLLFTGARSNVHPQHYGISTKECHLPFDIARDSTTLSLLRRAIDIGLPVFCICRGLQELNVSLGGTLASEIQNTPGNLDHRALTTSDLDVRFGVRHPVNVVEGSMLETIVGTTSFQVNSLHRQAIDRLSPSLRACAHAPDGVMEAVECPGSPGYLIGVQWHPEWFVRTDVHSRALFAAFRSAATAWRNR